MSCNALLTVRVTSNLGHELAVFWAVTRSCPLHELLPIMNVGSENKCYHFLTV